MTWVHPGLDEEALRSVKAEVSPCVSPNKNRQLKKLVQTPQNSAFSHDGYFEALNSFILDFFPLKNPLAPQLCGCPGHSLACLWFSTRRCTEGRSVSRGDQERQGVEGHKINKVKKLQSHGDSEILCPPAVLGMTTRPGVGAGSPGAAPPFGRSASAFQSKARTFFPDSEDRIDFAGEGGGEGEDGRLGLGVEQGQAPRLVVQGDAHEARDLAQRQVGARRGAGPALLVGEDHRPDALLGAQTLLPFPPHLLPDHPHRAAAAVSQLHLHLPAVAPRGEAGGAQHHRETLEAQAAVGQVLLPPGILHRLPVLGEDQALAGGLRVQSDNPYWEEGVAINRAGGTKNAPRARVL